jgi:hypothetical protein
MRIGAFLLGENLVKKTGQAEVIENVVGLARQPHIN